MHILVTGGAGFIGSHLVEYLLNKKHYLTIIDDLSTGKINNIFHVLEFINFKKSKVECVDLSSLKQIDAVIHLAAQASVPLSITDFKKSSTANILSTIKIIDFCRLNKIPLVYASSSAVYGELELGDDESDDVDLLSPYATDKYAMELYAHTANILYDLSNIGLRFFNVYGPRQDSSNPYSGVISVFIDRLLKEDNIVINGGYQTRDFIYVNDVVNAIYQALILALNNKVCEQINILTGSSLTINALADILIQEIGIEAKKVFKQLPKGDPEHSNGTCEKMKRILNIELSSMYTLNDGLKETIDYFRNGQDKKIVQ